MLRLVVLFVLSCNVEGRLRKPADSDVAEKLEVVEKESTPVFKKVTDQMRLVAKELEKGVTSKNKTEAMEAMKKATVSVADVKKEFDAVKKQFDSAMAGKKNNSKFPWWANASAGTLANFTQVAKNDTKFPWWANATAGNMPNLTQTKTEKVDSKKFPWWANASAGHLPNFTQITKDLPKNLPKGQPSFADLGPFESKEAACDYCFTSHTRTSVVPHCICTAYEASGGPTMFCTASAAGVEWVAGQDGGCKCTEKNPAAMGKTTCDPF